MTFFAAVGAGNLAGVFRLVESDDKNVWYSASEFATTDLWFYDPTTDANTLVYQLASSFPFNSIQDVATTGAGTQFTSFRDGGAGEQYASPFDDAGVAGTPIPYPSGPFSANLGTQIIYVPSVGYLVGVNSHGGQEGSGAMDLSGTDIWDNYPSILSTVDLIGPDGYVYGRGPGGIAKVDPATGVETHLLGTGSGYALIESDGTNLWTFDGTNIIVFDTSGSVVNTFTPPVSWGYVTFCYRPTDGLMYVTGVTTSGPQMPLYSIDPSTGVPTLVIASMRTNVDTINGSLCFADGTMYFSTSYSTAGGQLIQVASRVGQLLMMV